MAHCSTLSYGLRTADKFGVRERTIFYLALKEAAVMTKPMNVPFYNIRAYLIKIYCICLVNT
jgi:hypothetical protein